MLATADGRRSNRRAQREWQEELYNRLNKQWQGYRPDTGSSDAGDLPD